MMRFLIGATSSNVGKTTIALGLMRALTKRGLTVQPFKVGPDYIDPLWHQKATYHVSYNIDAFMLDDKQLLSLFTQHAQKSDINVIEGVMGLFDGYGVDPNYASSAAIAKKTLSPVILVVDGKSVSVSIAATVLGFKLFDKDLHIAGVIVNRVNSDRHFSLLKNAIETYCDIPVVGRLPYDQRFQLPSRQLGLSTDNTLGTDLFWNTLSEAIEEYIDIDQIIRLSDCSTINSDLVPDENEDEDEKRKYQHVVMAVAKDEAFQFYYADNLELLTSFGVTLVEFSPLHDKELPPCNTIYIGSGNPELFAKTLSENRSMRASILKAHENNTPIYAECGGLLYLSQNLEVNEKYYEMVGAMQGIGRITNKLQPFGYCFAEANQENLLSNIGKIIRGHSFHYSQFQTDLAPIFTLYKEENGQKVKEWQGGYQVNNTFGSHLHLHFYHNKELVSNWLDKIKLL